MSYIFYLSFSFPKRTPSSIHAIAVYFRETALPILIKHRFVNDAIEDCP